MRILILGQAGSGKTTLAKVLSSRHDLDHIEVDQLFWRPGWTPAPKGEFESALLSRLQGENWVCEGHFTKIRHHVQDLVTHVIWLDLPLWALTARVARRTLARLPESGGYYRDLFTKESPVWNLILNYRSRQKAIGDAYLEISRSNPLHCRRVRSASRDPWSELRLKGDE